MEGIWFLHAAFTCIDGGLLRLFRLAIVTMAADRMAP